jgi:phosphoglycerol transferase MdoB-like AlkP superfamily enzyme
MLLLLACTMIALVLCYDSAVTLFRQGSFYRDFAAIWSFGRFAAAGHGADIYNEAALHPFQVAQTGADHPYPYAYPPFFLLLLWPLGVVRSFAAAYLLWVGSTFALYLFASCAGHARGGRLGLLLTIAPGPA